ncbi:LysR family transcriptional regulator [Pseudomonas sp. CGJS7]|uniref:LysR family transcriptional regulator n=1 Tax=Pseudomonas sp. CGJS7 TaxID=3109348 RepID=UPI00300BA404
MIQIIDMTSFVTVVKVGSFTDAARRLDTAKSVVSRRVSDLERELGAPLLDRSARGVRPTEVGAVYYAKCVRILESIQAANDFVAGFNSLVKGRLSVIASRQFEGPLTTLLNKFAEQYPDILLDVEVGSEGNLDDLEFDVAIRTSEIDSSGLVARQLTRYRNLLCASPDYLQRCGTPSGPEDLARHDGLGRSQGEVEGVWRLLVDGQWRDCRYREKMRSYSEAQLTAAASGGLGIALLPEPLIQADIYEGRLTPVLSEFPAISGMLCAVYPKSRRSSQKVQKLLAFLAESLKPEDWMGAADTLVPCSSSANEPFAPDG